MQSFNNLQNVLVDGQFEFFSTIFSDGSELIPVNSVIDNMPGVKIINKFNAKENFIVKITNLSRNKIVNENLSNKKKESNT